MISNSKEWARARGLLYKSEVHGAEEWKIPTEKEFELLNRRGSAMKLTQRLDMEDCVTNEYMVFYLLSFRDTIMHIYIYVYIPIYLYIYIYVYRCLLQHIARFIYLSSCLSISRYLSLYLSIYPCLSLYVCICTCNLSMYTCHVFVCVYIHI